MKKIAQYSLVLLAFCSSIACYKDKEIYNRSVETEKYGKMLLGRQTKSQLRQEPFNSWFDEEYNSYEYDPQVLKELKKNNLNTSHITVFFGTWCGDTHRELPRLIKVLDAAKFPEEKLTLIAVNRKIETPNGEDVPYNIRRVPTIIVKKYGKEVGRIIEMTQSGSIETDLLNIIKKK